MRVNSVALNLSAKKICDDFNLALFQAVRQYLNHIKETGDSLELICNIKVQPKADLVSGFYPCELNAPIDGENGTNDKNFKLAEIGFGFIDAEKETRKIKIVEAIQALSQHD